jgi:hypothetical protein
VDKYHSSVYAYFISAQTTENPRKNKSYMVKNISISNSYLTVDRETPVSGLWDIVNILVASVSLI